MGRQSYYSHEPKKRDARYDQRADSSQKEPKYPDNELASVTEQERLNMHRSQLAKHRSQHQELREEVKLLRTTTVEYRKQLKDANSDICKLLEEPKRIESQLSEQCSPSLHRSPLDGF